MTPPRLIGLYSPSPQAGKTTVATYLTEFGFYRAPFAAPIKRMARTFLIQLGYGPDDIDQLLTDCKEATLGGIRTSTRQILRTLGTEWGRTCIHPDVWLMCWERIATRHLNSGVSVVVDDVRFENEAELILRLGGELWSITRPDVPAHPTEHASEGALDAYPKFSQHLTNDATLLDLYGDVRSILDPALAA
ncbi:MAG: hypothetical protein ACO3LH_05645 [Steroidobacteraceae bacterium]